jgi:transcriptional regulator with XRE-family HTH domain
MSGNPAPAGASIGERLRQLRGERALTQETLAALSGVSVDLVKKLEQGKRESARLTTLAALADALDVPLSQLMDKRPRLDGGGDRLVLGLRDALLSPALLPGIDPDDSGEATPLPALETAVRRAWADYWGGRFVELARIVPRLVAEARLTERAVGVPAAGVLARSYQVAACLLVHLGRDDLAAIGAERAIAAAAKGDDELQWAVLHGTYTWALLSQARYGEAEQLAIRTAERIEPRFSSATEEHLTVWGGLVLWAMAAAVEGARRDTALDYISLSRVGAARMDRDRHDYEVNFGPTQVAMQSTYAYSLLGEPDRALTAARDVRREDLHTISYGRHLLDVAQAHTSAGHHGPAVDVLHEAQILAPVWFRHQPAARTLVAELRERSTRLSPALRDLVRSLGPA